LATTLSLIFLIYRARDSSPSTRPSVVDLVLVVMAVVPCANFLMNYEELTRRVGIVTDGDVVMAVMISIASFEASRRILGWSLPIIASFMVVYAIFGNYFPDLVSHAGMPYRRVFSTIYGTN